MDWVALSAGRCGSECVEYSDGQILTSKRMRLMLIILWFITATKKMVVGLVSILLKRQILIGVFRWRKKCVMRCLSKKNIWMF